MGKSGLRFQHLDCTLSPLEQLNLTSLFGVLLLLGKFHFVIAHKLLFGVAHLKVHLQRNLTDDRRHCFLAAWSLFCWLGLLALASLGFPKFGCVCLTFFHLNDALQVHRGLELEIRRQKQLSHFEGAAGPRLIDLNFELGPGKITERFLVDAEVVKRHA